MSLRVVVILVIAVLSGCATLPLPMTSDGLMNLRADASGAMQDAEGRYFSMRRLRSAGERGHPMPSAVHVELAPNTSIGTVMVICSELQPIRHLVTLYSGSEGARQSYRCG